MNVRVTRVETPHRATLYSARVVEFDHGQMTIVQSDGEETFFDVTDAKVEIDTESGGDEAA